MQLSGFDNKRFIHLSLSLIANLTKVSKYVAQLEHASRVMNIMRLVSAQKSDSCNEININSK